MAQAQAQALPNPNHSCYVLVGPCWGLEEESLGHHLSSVAYLLLVGAGIVLDSDTWVVGVS